MKVAVRGYHAGKAWLCICVGVEPPFSKSWICHCVCMLFLLFRLLNEQTFHYLQLEVTCTHFKKIINQQECMGKLSLGYI